VTPEGWGRWVAFYSSTRCTSCYGPRQTLSLRWLLSEEVLLAMLPHANLNLLGSFDTNSCTVAPGVTYTRIERGEQSRKDFYTVDVAFETDLAAAKAAAKELSAEGYEPMIEKISERAPDDPQNGPLGYLVRVGSFATRAEADTLRAELTEEGYTGLRTVYIGEGGSDTSGPWVVHVLEIDPDLYDGTVTPVLATGIIPERETLSSISDGTDSLAAINLAHLRQIESRRADSNRLPLLITSDHSCVAGVCTGMQMPHF
jgi:hypothetical protein